jgi:hypothetical protein
VTAVDAVALVDRVVAAHNQRDTEALATCYAAGATFSMDAWQTPADLATWSGALDALRESFPDLVLRRERVTSGEGVVVAEVRMAGTNTGPLNLGTVDRLVLHTDTHQLPPTGRVMDVVGLVLMEHDDGEVVAERHHWPEVDILVQLGLVALGDPVEVAR